MHIMKRYIIFCIMCISLSWQSFGQVIPRPASVEKCNGYFKMGNAVCCNAPRMLQAYIAESGLGWTSAADGNVKFVFADTGVDGEAVSESYTLLVSKDSIIITAPEYAGMFYAVQTLLQLADFDKGRIPCVRIEDAPRFAWRGFMLDVSRHFFGFDFVKKQIDALAMLKLNRLHLHLTDAAGWRMEIEKYPLLTSLAAWREGDTWKEWWFGERKYLPEGTEGAYGGYFTKAQLRELVQYAAVRAITIVPEIELPSHSEEVLAAYPELSCTGEPYKHSDFCIGKEESFEFLENVLTEVMEVFPSEYINIGGDEASKKAWAECPACRARMDAECLDGVDELQSYMVRRIGKFLKEHGRTLVGWDEIMQGGVDEEAVVLAWRGENMGVKAAMNGNRTIMAPGSYCYFDTYQDAPERLPDAMSGYLPLEKVYAFEPAEAVLNACREQSADTNAADNVIGLQANMWSEYISTPEHAELMVYPRLFALSEVGWTSSENRNYDDFHKRALRLCSEMRADGYNAFDLSREYGNRKEYYTLVKHRASGCKVTYNAPYNNTYSAGGDSALTDGMRGGWTFSDGRWQGFISRRRMDVTVDLGKVQKLRSVEATFIQVSGPEIYLPAEVVISASEDGVNFTELYRNGRDVIRDTQVDFVTEKWNGRTECRYIRMEARSGQYGGWVFTDEIIVR